MDNPQVENGYTMIANETMDELAKIRIPGQARQVLDFILRKTYGWHKTKDNISLSQFVAGTGLSKITVCKCLNKLLDMKLITRKTNKKSITQYGNDQASTYGFQKRYRYWKRLPKKVIVTQKGNRVLPNMVHTKETNTKERKDLCPQQSILDLYHTILPELTRHKQWNGTRAINLRARWNEKIPSNSGDFHTGQLEYWKGLFGFIRESDFLMGRTAQNGKHPNWRTTLDWIVKKDNFLKIIEGNYANKS